MRKILVIQYATMLVLAFVSGVACYQLFELEQIVQVITWGDRRLLTLDEPASIFWNAFPVILSVGVVLFFSTHRYLPIMAPIFIAIKMTFFGFSSVFLLVQHESVKLYGLWWFPFQFIYCILLIVMYHTSLLKNSNKLGQKVVSKKGIVFLFLLTCSLLCLEIVVISTIIK